MDGAADARGIGLDAFYQPFDERSGNAVGQLKGTGGGPALLLYAPIDTHLRAEPHEDIPGLDRNCVLTCSPTVLSRTMVM